MVIHSSYHQTRFHFRWGLIANINNEYLDHIIWYTDGSKANSKTGYAFSIHDLIVSNRLRNSASVFTAELNAILTCLSYLTHRLPRDNYLLLTDSLSSLQSLRNTASTNAITQRIHIVLQTLSTIQSSVIFIWIPGHTGHPQHDRVDQAAKEATLFLKISDSTPAPLYNLEILYRHRIPGLLT